MRARQRFCLALLSASACWAVPAGAQGSALDVCGLVATETSLHSGCPAERAHCLLCDIRNPSLPCLVCCPHYPLAGGSCGENELADVPQPRPVAGTPVPTAPRPTPASWSPSTAPGCAISSCGAGSQLVACSCQACTSGTFSPDSGAACAPCPAGTFCPTGSASATPCPTRTVSTAGSAACAPCPAGSSYVAGGVPCSLCPAGSSSSGGDACAPCPERQSSQAGGLCAACPAGQSSPSGGPCTACTQLVNYNFADGLSGWTYLSDAGSTPNGFYSRRCANGQGCFGDATGTDVRVGSKALLSSAHTVLPGEVLVLIGSTSIIAFAVASPDSMHYFPQPATIRSQARIVVYDAGDPAFPTAASLQDSLFDATNIEAGPYLGNLIGNAGFVATYGLIRETFDLAPYAGKTVYFVYRSSNNNNNPGFAYVMTLTGFAISCT